MTPLWIRTSLASPKSKSAWQRRGWSRVGWGWGKKAGSVSGSRSKPTVRLGLEGFRSRGRSLTLGFRERARHMRFDVGRVRGLAHQAAVGAEAHVVGLEVAVEQLETGPLVGVRVRVRATGSGLGFGLGLGLGLRLGLARARARIGAGVRVRVRVRVRTAGSWAPGTRCGCSAGPPPARCRTATRAAAARP